MPSPREAATTAAHSLAGVVRGVAGRAASAVGRSSPQVQQTLTVGRPVEEVAGLWRDASSVRQVLGDVGSVEVDPAEDGDERWTWRLAVPGSEEPLVWRTTLADGGEPLTLRWSDPDDADSSSEVVVVLREAPQDLGTEQVVRLDLPVPGLVAGAAALTLGYRARALLLTGEIATITPQPSGRSGDR